MIDKNKIYYYKRQFTIFQQLTLIIFFDFIIINNYKSFV